MLRSYDLLIQAKTPGKPFARELALGALAKAGATLDAEGRGAWRLPKGEVEVSPLTEGGACVGLEVKVPLSDRTDLLEAVVRALADVVEQGPVRAVDPQRSAEASVTGLASMTDEFFRLARHAGEYHGVSEAVGLTSYAQPPETFSTTSRLLGALLAFLVALYASWRIVSSLLEGEPEAPVDPPAKVLGK